MPDEKPGRPIDVDPNTKSAAKTIYVALLDEGLDTYSPVDSLPEGPGTYRLPANEPPGERWALPPGSLVRCEPRTLDDGEHLVAASAD